MIRIYSKKAFALGPGVQKNSVIADSFVTVPMAFQDIDEKYTECRMFKAAVKCGDITVIEKKPVINISKVEFSKEEKEEVPTFKTPADFKEDLKAMKAERVYELAKEYGAEFIDDDKLSQNKKRVYEAYKLMYDENVEEIKDEEIDADQIVEKSDDSDE